ncbi:MAG: ABC-type branched-chain amino acid transport system, ATPase component, partial [Solirubrobacteraceae bacterium]|nr:ABC-type branched-chain amino acid transport system, ATPase component [Solirubrobacteraceae bacterium]
IGGAVGAALSLRHWDPLLCVLFAGLVGAGAAVIVGLPALRIRGLYLAVTTLAFSVFTSAWLLTPDTLHWLPNNSQFLDRNPAFGRIDISTERRFYYFCLVCLLLGMAMARGLRNSRTGRALIGIRDNERGAQSYGVNAVRVKLTAFAVSGFLAASAGVLYVLSQQALGTARFQPGESLRVFTMVVIGGMGSIPGAIIGSLYLNGTQWFVDILPSSGASRTVFSFLGTGVGLIVVLLVLPGGLGDLLFRCRDRFLRAVAGRRGLAVPSLTADAAEGGADRDRRPPALTEGEAAPGALRLTGIEAGYDGVQVLFGVDLEIGDGEIVALLGTNGAGKSTVLRAITGLTPPSAGHVVYDGVTLNGLAPDQILKAGVAQVPGGRGIFPSLTVADNLRMATWLFRRDASAVREGIDDAYRRFPVLQEKADVIAGDLSGGQQQMLTLAQTFMTKPRMILIDELSLGLAPVVVEELIGAVRQLRDEGTSIVLVEQSVNVALTVADRAYFMEKGEVRFEGPTADLLDRPDVLRSVFVEGALAAGGEAPAAAPAAARRGVATKDRPVVLSVEGIARSFGGVTAVDDVSFELRQGQILGIIGPNGAGKTTVFDLISGFTPVEHGSIHLRGVDVTRFGPDVRARMGLGRSFQDARLFPGLTVSETIMLAFEREIRIKDPIAALVNLPAVSLEEQAIARRVDELVELLGLGAFRDKFVAELSTGSRRIVDLACVMAHRPDVLLFDEPSSGIAQRETEALGPLIQRIQRETGASILVIEHDMPLISAVSDEMIAMHLGAVMLRGKPKAVLNDDRVIETYLGGHQDIIHRSGLSTAATSAPS